VLTTAEFRVATNRHLRREVWLTRFILLLIIACITFRWIVDLDKWLLAHIHPAFPTWLAEPYALYGEAIIVLIFASWLSNRLAHRDPRLVCPRCTRGLLRSWCHIIGTGKCPFCQTEILDAPEQQKPTPLTRAEAEALAAREWRVSRDFFLGIAILCLVVAPVGFACDALHELGSLANVVSICIVCLMAVAFFGWINWIVIRSFRLLWTFTRCPRCGCYHNPLSVVKLERCYRCSQPLIAEPADKTPMESQETGSVL
jgi:hypothetical protein